MRYKLSDICFYAKGKVDVSGLTDADYISTENMMPNKGGVTIASSLPSTAQTQAYRKDDVLVSNIRPYFKKIWFANCNGGCSNDVLVFRAKEDTDARFLYYVLADDAFFDYSTATSKGTKMPRGDKTAIMQYEVPHFDLPIQKKIAGILADIDNKISLNNNINNNLEQQAVATHGCFGRGDNEETLRSSFRVYERQGRCPKQSSPDISCGNNVSRKSVRQEVSVCLCEIVFKTLEPQSHGNE